jgi:Uma2 family endonuclease
MSAMISRKTAPADAFAMPGAVAEQLYRVSVEQFHRMIDADIFPPDTRVELLDGYLVEKMTRKPRHDNVIDLLNFELFRRLPTGWFLRIKEAVTLTDSEPEPDIAVVRGPRSYAQHHPYASEVGLLIEVADSSLAVDREKARIYAANNLASLWIINLNDSKIEVYAGPSGPVTAPGYATCEFYGSQDLVPLVLDGQQVATIPVKDLLP